MLSRSRLPAYKTRATSFFSSHTAQIFSTSLTIAVIAISTAVIAYTTASLSWVNNYYSNGNGPLTLLYQNYSSYPSYEVNATWRNEVAYNAGALEMYDEQALLAASVLGVVASLLLIAIPFCLREPRPLFKLKLPWGDKALGLQLSNITATTALDATLTISLLVVTTFVGVRRNHSPYPDDYLLPDHHFNHTANVGPYAGTTFERWNCAMVYQMDPNAQSPSRNQISRQCLNASRGRDLIVPLLVLVLVRLSLRPMTTALGFVWEPIKEFLEWKKHTRDMREGNGTELDHIRKKRVEDEESGREGGDSVNQADGHETFIAELPACRLSRVEMDEDAAVTEMPGGEGGKEMDAGVAAVEKDAGGKS